MITADQMRGYPGYQFAAERGFRVVVKYDGLAQGKGVFICEDERQFVEAVNKAAALAIERGGVA